MPTPDGMPQLPAKGTLGDWLSLSDAAAWDDVGELLSSAMLVPLEDFLARPGKRFRGQLVELGFALSGAHGGSVPGPQEVEWIARAAKCLEALHAGSLVIDDIQDGSEVRRGAPTLHRRYGVPVAINAGNWLYFWPLEQLSTWGLDPARELSLHRLCVEALLRAHFGQGLDVGVRIDELEQARIPAACAASLELKTGALMALGIGMGAVLGRAEPERRKLLETFGREFGCALQRFDDIANLRLPEGDPKRFEDLRLGRPSWAWATIARDASPADFAAFVAAVRQLPEAKALVEWLERHTWLDGAAQQAKRRLEESVLGFSDKLEALGDFEAELTSLRALAEKLGRAYV